MNILILEDNLFIAEVLKSDLKNYLENKVDSLYIAVCNTIYEANSAIENTNYDFIISDLNMNPMGLSDSYLNETMGAIVTGWVWIYHYVFKKNKNSFVIFYSAFTEVLIEVKEYQNYKNQSILFNKAENNVEDISRFILKKMMDI